jgi:hypothetical protein
LPALTIPACGGYGQTRIYYETQSWWEPIPSVGGQGHIHMGTCWPHGKAVKGNVRLDFNILLHFQVGTIVRLKVQDDMSTDFNTYVLIPVTYANEYVVNRRVWIDTTKMPDGLRQWRIYVYVEHANGNSQRTKAMYRVRVNNIIGKQDEIGPKYSEYGGAGWYKEADGTDWGYQTAEVEPEDHLPQGTCVSGTWTPEIDTSSATEHLVTIDPAFHAGNMGLVLEQGTGEFEGDVAVDTTLLAPGWHKLVVHSGTREGEEENGGAFVYPFRVC